MNAPPVPVLPLPPSTRASLAVPNRSPLAEALGTARWSEALDLLRAGARWDDGALGETPSLLLLRVLNTVPLATLDDLMELGLPVDRPVGSSQRPPVTRWFVDGASPRRIEVLDRLLAHGVSIDLTDRLTRTTFLATACRQGDAVAVQALLDRGADPHRTTRLVVQQAWLRPELRDHWLLNGWTALHLAAQLPAARGATIVQALLDAGADPQARTELPWGPADALTRFQDGSPPTDAERQAGLGWTPLDVARAYGVQPILTLFERWALLTSMNGPSAAGEHTGLRRSSRRRL